MIMIAGKRKELKAGHMLIVCLTSGNRRRTSWVRILNEIAPQTLLHVVSLFTGVHHCMMGILV